MKKIMLILFIGMLLLIIQSTASAMKDCDECKKTYDACIERGFSHDECVDFCNTFGCRECGDYWSSSSGGVCLITPFFITLLCCVFIIYYGKKREMKK
jgi:hypothetical protein